MSAGRRRVHPSDHADARLGKADSVARAALNNATRKLRRPTPAPDHRLSAGGLAKRPGVAGGEGTALVLQSFSPKRERSSVLGCRKHTRRRSGPVSVKQEATHRILVPFEATARPVFRHHRTPSHLGGPLQNRAGPVDPLDPVR